MLKATVEQKSKQFAIRIIKVYQYLTLEKKEFVLSKQLLRSGTSIGANLAEGECSISKRDFLAKMYISLKECNESLYWLDLLFETDYLSEREYVSLRTDCDELRRMLSSITKTTQYRISNGFYDK